MARTLEPNHTLGQLQDARTPYIYMVFTSADGLTTYDFSMDSIAYGNRILLIDHTEEPYNDFAYIMLQNTDRLIPDLKGYYTNICYGDTYGGSNYYTGGKTAKLWVKEQRLISAGGKLYTLLVLEGIWSFFREQELIGDMESALVKRYYDPDNFVDTSDLQSETIFGVIGLIEQYVDSACGTEIVLYMTSDQDDGIINYYIPGMELNAIPYESCADLMQQLLGFTKCFIRMKNDDTMEVRYPQDSEAVDHTYYSYQQHYFFDYTNNDTLLIPNHIVVLAGQYLVDTPPYLAGDWPPYTDIIVAEAEDATEIASYMRVTNLHIAGFIQDEAAAQDRAEAILYKTAYQRVAGQLVIPHDAAIELYDKVEVIDQRGL